MSPSQRTRRVGALRFDAQSAMTLRKQKLARVRVVSIGQVTVPVAEVTNSAKTSKKFILVLYFAAQSPTESERDLLYRVRLVK
jgi:hypothetical protein